MSTASNKQTNDADIMTAHNDIGSIGKGIITPEDIDNAEKKYVASTRPLSLIIGPVGTKMDT